MTASTCSNARNREAIDEPPNPLGLDGIEFVEFATRRPQALGQVLEIMGFRPIARHRSREVLLYRQGSMNIVINAHAEGVPEAVQPGDAPEIAAIALRVRDAGAAWRRAIERGGWPVPAQPQPMELHIPALHGVGRSRIYLVDRYKDFSIYDVDFVPIPTVDPHPPAVAGLHWFGVVQYIGLGRMDDWTEFYGELFGFSALPDETRFGILPRGRVLASPCGQFYLQLIEPEPDAMDADPDETLHRVAFGTPDVRQAVRELTRRGMNFVESSSVHTEDRGALTQTWLGSVAFELVHHPLPTA
ncbi:MULTISPECIES: VOC family protein [Caldimonas]|uniref:VOC family protein n=1 Tax=Caldimonas TaxID=196013 RepID=UPI00036B4DF1|nr:MULTISPECIES: VOC family protein [Caldimonas]MCX7660548.1 4-hydroxyphenylpyruvate dioxygenase [Caldimonas manganoxidans]GIX25867.1 MAG: 4-hydroxyphenylpyruvate dioxygenase [Caldimonas sp.]